MAHLQLQDVPLHYMQLFRKTSEGYVKIDPNYSVSRINRVSHCGFSVNNPFILKRSDLITVRISECVSTLSIGASKTYWQVAELIRKQFIPQATSADQIVLLYDDSNPLDLSEELPPYKIGDESKVLHASMPAKTVYVLNEFDEEGKHRRITCDADIEKLSYGLYEISPGGEAVDDDIIEQYHLLKEGATYKRSSF
jgi:hypothetical protein